MKKFIALLVSVVMMFTLCACGGGNGATQLDVEGANDPLTKDDVITMLVPSDASNPFREDWKLWEYMAEGSGATLDLIAVPATDMGTKLPVLFAARDELPDVMAFSMNYEHGPYAGEGLVAFEDLEAYMPTYNAWKNSLSEEEYAIAVKPRVKSDGKIYYSPATGREGKARLFAWLYREDIFEKHNLKVPETHEELYDVCKQLKDIYPDSYPFCFRAFSLIDASGSSFDKWWEYDAYYDFDDEEWRWGTAEDTALEVISFYKKMVDEKLMPADFITMKVSAFDELILTNRAFIMPSFLVRVDDLNRLATGKIDGFKMQAIAPPVANSEKGAAMVERGDIEQFGLSVCDTGKPEGIANAAKFIDWMYTDEAMELVSWGKEGETYEVVDGKKKFITDENGSAPKTMYGFQNYGSFCRLDPLAVEATQSETTLECEDLVLEHTLPYHPVTKYLDFNEEEQTVVDTYFQGLLTYTEEMFIKFILGQEPLSNFDKFVETLEEMGVEDLLAAYESAYNRVK